MKALKARAQATEEAARKTCAAEAGVEDASRLAGGKVAKPAVEKLHAAVALLRGADCGRNCVSPV